jgi:RNA polymerase sigma factor (sigma-70 family)
MLLQLEGIGNQKIAYKDPSAVEFDNLNEYTTMAKKSISKFANRFYSGLSSKMLKDEDAISSVTNAIIMADWRYDENYEGTNGAKKTKYSYRNQCALWAIQTYVTKNYKKNKNTSKVYSLNYNNSENEDDAYNYIVDNRTKTPEQIILEKEKHEEVSKLIRLLLSSELLTKNQSEYIKLYYFENCTYEQIGQKFNLTREAIRQSINKALSVIRDISNKS